MGTFYGCSGLVLVKVYAETPPTLDLSAHMFSGTSETCVLKVPLNKTQAYADAGWNKYFQTVQEFEEE